VRQRQEDKHKEAKIRRQREAEKVKNLAGEDILGTQGVRLHHCLDKTRQDDKKTKQGGGGVEKREGLRQSKAKIKTQQGAVLS
jgi:hypothetical protein